MSIYDLYPESHEFDVKMDLKRALQRIANSQRNRETSLRIVYALKQRYQYDRTYAQIGKDLGVSPERVRQLIARGIRMLRWPGYGFKVKGRKTYA